MKRGRLKKAGTAGALTLVSFVLVSSWLVSSVLVGTAVGQTPPAAPSAAPHHGPSAEDLRGLESEIERAVEEQRRLNSEIETAAADTQKLRTGLVDVAKRLRAAEERVAKAETRLGEIEGKEGTLRRSLQGREKVTAEVLAAMQRIGRKPPPALLVQPDDALSAMRAAVLLGAVVPQMRDEARVLIADLKTLSALADENRKVTVALRAERDATDEERKRLATLIEQRQGQVFTSREQLEAARARMAALSRDAKSLRDLIAKGEAEAIGNARAVEIARRAPPPVKEGREVAALGSGARLGPRVPFAQRKGQLSWPVSGEVTKRFGGRDALGGLERGVTFAANTGAVVTAPADGWVHFAAPFRGYGHLLIINAGNGYHVVLAGMERLSVDIGQFVLAGEPVGFMSAGSGVASSGSAAVNTQGATVSQGSALGVVRPALYVEFRKDGSPVDPSPWWTSQLAEKARG